MKRTNQFAFWNGWNSVPSTRWVELREKLMTALGIGFEAFKARRRGAVEPKVSEKEIIEKVFKEDFKVPASHVWGGTYRQHSNENAN